MIVSKRQILTGAASFIEAEVIGHVADVPTKLMLGAIAYRMHNSPETFEALVFDNPAAKVLLAECEGGYDLDASLNGVLNSLQSYGNLSITIPAIPLLSKVEKVLTFTPQDIERLRQIIANGGA